MPRKAREKSNTGIYHIILRGTNRQEIFHEDEDNIMFLETLEKYSRDSGTNVYGWCLMSNHVHLLLGEGSEELSITMKRIEVSFVWYYNWKYKTTGHLFQDRFKSESVESDEYLLTVIRYIHQNPVEAGLVKQVEDWKWSSCHAYYGKNSYPANLLESNLVLGMFSVDNKHTAISRFINFTESASASKDKCLDDEIKIRITDEDARQAIMRHVEGIEIAQVKSLPKAERDEVFRKIKGIRGVTQRQAARILGVSSSLIFKA
ncbi:MAG: transposase [Desulfitobacteriaceae bacterium]|nr:transposase [Desulfitobacteriaceae bacterium]MDI6880832.1 transposase [Desulfitobacteriaceae bacterium]MDI6915949.1 transposase [Desulfitobacteriaceae bacterium]